MPLCHYYCRLQWGRRIRSHIHKDGQDRKRKTNMQLSLSKHILWCDSGKLFWPGSYLPASKTVLFSCTKPRSCALHYDPFVCAYSKYIKVRIYISKKFTRVCSWNLINTAENRALEAGGRNIKVCSKKQQPFKEFMAWCVCTASLSCTQTHTRTHARARTQPEIWLLIPKIDSWLYSTLFRISLFIVPVFHCHHAFPIFRFPMLSPSLLLLTESLVYTLVYQVFFCR